MPRACGISAALGAGLPTSLVFDTLEQLIRESSEPITRLEMLARWPANQTTPHPDSRTRCLTRACERGLITRTGTGSKSNPFRYSIAPIQPAP
jgi:hypothetical protein